MEIISLALILAGTVVADAFWKENQKVEASPCRGLKRKSTTQVIR